MPRGSLLLLFGIGCGGGATYHCDFRASEDPEPRCQERTARVAGAGAVTSEAFMRTCELVQGDGGDGPCPVDGIVAGCDITVGVGGETVVDWFYAPTTSEQVTASCDDDGGEVVQP